MRSSHMSRHSRVSLVLCVCPALRILQHMLNFCVCCVRRSCLTRPPRTRSQMSRCSRCLWPSTATTAAAAVQWGRLWSPLLSSPARLCKQQQERLLPGQCSDTAVGVSGEVCMQDDRYESGCYLPAAQNDSSGTCSNSISRRQQRQRRTAAVTYATTAVAAVSLQGRVAERLWAAAASGWQLRSTFCCVFCRCKHLSCMHQLSQALTAVDCSSSPYRARLLAVAAPHERH